MPFSEWCLHCQTYWPNGLPTQPKAPVRETGAQGRRYTVGRSHPNWPHMRIRETRIPVRDHRMTVIDPDTKRHYARYASINWGELPSRLDRIRRY